MFVGGISSIYFGVDLGLYRKSHEITLVEEGSLLVLWTYE